MTGIVWSIYALLEKKANNDIIILSGIGVVVLVLVGLQIRTIDIQEDELLEQLEKEE